MTNIVIYTKDPCTYCTRAKTLLDQKQVTYQEIRIDQQPEKRDEMIEKSHGQKTVPQIFINDTHIGGFDQLWELARSGELDEMLK